MQAYAAIGGIASSKSSHTGKPDALRTEGDRATPAFLSRALLLFTIYNSLFTAMIGFDRSALVGCTPFAAAIKKQRIE